MKPKSTLRHFLSIASSALLTISYSHAATLYWDGTASTANADGGAGAWNGTDLWDTLPMAGVNATWNSGTPDFAVFGGTASALVTTGAPIITSGIQFNTTGYTITADSTNTLSFSGTSNIIFNNVAAAAITGTVTGSGNVVLSTTNPATAGTLTLNGTSAGGWSGTTTINAGMTMSLAASNQALFNTTGITLNGGGITLTNANNTEGALDRVAAVGITSNGGGTITYANAVGGTAYAEALGTVALTTGQLNIVSTNAVTSGTQTLTLGTGSLTHAASNTSAIIFSGATLGANARNSIIVTGETDSAVGGIIGAWATWGATAASQTDYATYNRTAGGAVNAFGIQNANIAATAENSASWTAGGGNVTLGGATTLTGTRDLNSLRYTGGALALGLGASNFNLETFGVLNGGSGVLTISTTGTGALTSRSGGGNLYLTAGSNGITVSAPINNHSGGGVTTLVKSGSGNLTLSSTTSNYSGGTVVNAGTLTISVDSNLGATSGGLTFNGASTLTAPAIILGAARTITLNEGSSLNLNTSSNFGFAGKVTGSGAISVLNFNGYQFLATNNDFTGTVNIATAASTGYGFEATSIGDAVGSGLINLGVSGGTGGGTFRWLGSSGSTKTLVNRQFALAGATTVLASGGINYNVGGVIAARGVAASDNLVINKDLLITGAAGARALHLAGTNTGNNTFAGKITDGTDGGASVVSLIKSEAGTWILSGTNTYSGNTVLLAGTLIASSSANLGDGSATNNLVFNGGTLQANGAFTSPSTRGVTMTGAGTINTNGNALTIDGIITGAGALTKTGASDLTLSNANTFTGTTTVSAGKVVMTNALALQNSAYTTTGSNGTTIGLDVTSGLSSGNLALGGLAGTVNLTGAFTAGYGSVTQLTLNPQAGISNTYSVVIANGSGNMALTKTGAGTQVLSGANTYSGATTITAGILNANSTSALGNSSATNTLIFNGGTLQAAAAITSVATRGVTMTSTGIIDTNGFAVSIAGNIGGLGGLNKNSTGTLTLSGTNTYGGVTTVNAGTLAIPNEVSLASNTAANLNVKGGATLALNVGGAGQFTVTSLNTLLSNISVANTAAQGLQAGARIGIDTTNAGGSFTQGNVIANSTGAFGGAIGLTKLGTGILILDQDNTYTGTTLVSAGTLEVQGSIAASANIINNAALVFNGASAQGYANSISGTGTLTRSGGGTLTLSGISTFTGSTTVSGGNLTLSNALALRNSALVTTGAGTVTLGAGVVAPTFGGLSGASGDLATIITNYNTVTNITLNPPTGITHTYGGVIGEGATGMTLTKTGAGTQVLTGANLYTGATIINQGTLNLGGATATGSLASTVLTLSGGTFSYTRTGTNTQSFTTTNFTSGANQVSTSLATQTLELNNIVRSVGGTVNFSSAGGISTTNSLSNGILGGWATINNDNWATKTGANISVLGTYVNGTTTAGDYTNANINIATATVGGVIDTNSLRFSGSGAKTLTLAAGDNIIQSGGILVRSDVGNFGSAITGGNLAGSSGGDLIIHNHNTNTNGALTIGSLIKNNTSATALTKSGPGNLILTNAANSYSGGTFVNGGTLTFSVAGAWVSGQNLTFGGAGTVSGPNSTTLTGGILSAGNGVNATIGAGASTTFNFTSTTGAGTINYTGGGILNLADASGFTGDLISSISGANNSSRNIQFSSIADTAGSLIGWGGQEGDSNQRAMLTLNGNVGSVTFNNRQVAFLPNSGNSPVRRGILQNNNTSALHTFVINTDLFNNGVSGKQELILDGTNAGNNAFNGIIGNSINNGSAQRIIKTGTGKWILGGNNTFTGLVIVNQGTLSVGNINNADVAGPLGMNNTIQLGGQDEGLGGSAYLGNNSGTLEYTGAGQTSTRSFRIGEPTSAGNNGAGTIVNNGTGALVLSATNFNPTIAAITATRTLGLGGSNTAANTVQGVIQNNNTAGNGLTALTKADAGRWILSGTNTYTGATSINAGALQAADGTGLPTSSILQLRGGVFQGSGTFTRTVGTAAGNVNWSTGSGGFAAIGGTLNLNLNGGTGSLTWNGSSMVSTGQTLIFGSTTADSLVDWQNSLNLGSSGSGQRTIQVNDNTGSTTDIARISGAIINTAAGWGIIKTGDGTLQLNGVNTYTGLTSVNAGTLGGTGTIAGAVTVAAAGNLAPGASVGTLTITNNLTVSAMAGGTGVMTYELGPIATSDKIAITGALDIGVGALGFNNFAFSNAGGLQNGTYKLITSGAAVTGTLDGANLTGTVGSGSGTLQITGNDLELVVSGIGAGTPYDTWATSKGLTGANNAKTDDPDKDGRNNLAEFAFNGDPLNGSDNGKIFVLTEDSDFDVELTTKELILTVAVRSLTPVFAGAPSPSANQAADNITYNIEGSLDLAGFPTTVNVVSPVITGLPAAGAGYEYRSFSLNGSNGLTSKGFLRAKVTSP